jgi:hypothetical protein
MSSFHLYFAQRTKQAAAAVAVHHSLFTRMIKTFCLTLNQDIMPHNLFHFLREIGIEYLNAQLCVATRAVVKKSGIDNTNGLNGLAPGAGNHYSTPFSLYL